MQEWLEWARGPAFRACFLIMILGILRIVALNAMSLFLLIQSSRRNGRAIEWNQVASATVQWLFPLKKGLEKRAIFSLTSMIFHVTMIVTPVFLGAHIVLWKRGLGISWPAINNTIADYLTLITIVAGIALLVGRIGLRASRSISRIQDYALPLLIILPFASGYLAMHPNINPFEYDRTMFIHVISGNAIFALLPFTKISHVVLFPATQLVSELGWHLAPGAGQRVAEALGKESEPL